MNCKSCGAENADDAVYCGGCGARMDGKTQCMRCGQWNPSDAVYCGGCGARMDGKQKCPQCGTLLPGEMAFCTQCGAELGRRQARAPHGGGSDARQTTAMGVDRILQIVKVSLAITVASLALLFVFLINVGGSYMYETFGPAYKDLRTMLDAMEEYSPLFEASLLSSLVFMTVFFAGALVSVITFSTVALVRGILYLTGKNTRNTGEAQALLSFAYLLIGTLSLLSVVNVRAGDTAIGLGGGSVAGLILCGVFTALYLGVAIVQKRKELCERNTMLRTVFCGIGLVLTVVMLVLQAAPVLGMSDGTESARLGFVALMGGSGLLSEIGATAVPDGAWSVFGFGMVGQALQTALLAVVAVYFVWRITGYAENRKATLVYPIAAAVLALALLVFAILTGNAFVDVVTSGMPATAEVSSPFSYAIPIVLLVFSVLNVAFAAVERAVCKSVPTAMQTQPGEMQ